VDSERFDVSVVIPAYNEAARIEAAIASVRAQSEPSAEILVVDDGSTDATGELAARQGARVIRRPNGGLSAARNTGLREARFPWIAFLDADDRWWPEKLAAARAAHEAEPAAALIFSDYRVVYDGTRALGPALSAIPQYRRVGRRRVAADCVAPERDALLEALVAGNFLLTSTLVVRRDFVVDHELFYDERLPVTPEYHTSEDVEWFLRAVPHADALLIERVLTDYHRHSGNMSGSAGRLKFGDVKLGERVVAAPERYGERTAALFRAIRPAHLRESAVLHMRSLEFARARAVAAQALREKPSADALGLVVLAALGDTFAGRAGARAARALWRGARSS
jgi:glycosyltransferase involved in cell wall biosynthesis